MDTTLKCPINVKFLKWKIAMWLCKGMSVFKNIYSEVFRDKNVYEQLTFKCFRDSFSLSLCTTPHPTLHLYTERE